MFVLFNNFKMDEVNYQFLIGNIQTPIINRRKLRTESSLRNSKLVNDFDEFSDLVSTCHITKKYRIEQPLQSIPWKLCFYVNGRFVDESDIHYLYTGNCLVMDIFIDISNSLIPWYILKLLEYISKNMEYIRIEKLGQYRRIVINVEDLKMFEKYLSKFKFSYPSSWNKRYNNQPHPEVVRSLENLCDLVIDTINFEYRITLFHRYGNCYEDENVWFEISENYIIIHWKNRNEVINHDYQYFFDNLLEIKRIHKSIYEFNKYSRKSIIDCINSGIVRI